MAYLILKSLQFKTEGGGRQVTVQGNLDCCEDYRAVPGCRNEDSRGKKPLAVLCPRNKRREGPVFLYGLQLNF